METKVSALSYGINYPKGRKFLLLLVRLDSFVFFGLLCCRWLLVVNTSNHLSFPYGQTHPKGEDDVFRGFLKPSPKKNEKRTKVYSTYVDTYNKERNCFVSNLKIMNDE